MIQLVEKSLGKQYDEFGCNVVNKTQNGEAKPVLLITKYEGIVVKYGDLYGVINGQGNEIVSPVVQSIYSVTSGDYTTYYMTYNNQSVDVLAYIQQVLDRQNNQTNNQTDNQTNNQTNNQIDNQTNTNDLNSNNIVQQ